MTAVCGYGDGDFNSPAVCGLGFGCIVIATPSVFGCTNGVSTKIPTICMEAGEQTASPTTGVFTCPAETPYCATISLLYSGLYYTHWECAIQANQIATILASPTITGDAVAVTHYLEAAAETPATTTSLDDDSGGGGTVIGNILGGIAGLIAAIAGVGLWFCTKRHFQRQRAYQAERDGNDGRCSYALTGVGPSTYTSAAPSYTIRGRLVRATGQCLRERASLS